jgi:tetratricopeptide (TPR) repeat protein
MKNICLIFLFIEIIFFQKSYADQLKLKSEPADAVVYIRDLNGTIKNKIGKTPYEGNIQEIASTYAKSNFFILVLEKDGYESQSILLNDLLKSDIELNMNMVAKEDILEFRKLDKSINDLFESQRLLREQQYTDAISLLKNIEKEQPKLSIVPEMIGSAQYLAKDQKAALSWYEKAYRLNPENKDAYTMKSYLRKALGGMSDGK